MNQTSVNTYQQDSSRAVGLMSNDFTAFRSVPRFNRGVALDEEGSPVLDKRGNPTYKTMQQYLSDEKADNVRTTYSLDGCTSVFLDLPYHGGVAPFVTRLLHTPVMQAQIKKLKEQGEFPTSLTTDVKADCYFDRRLKTNKPDDERTCKNAFDMVSALEAWMTSKGFSVLNLRRICQKFNEMLNVTGSPDLDTRVAAASTAPIYQNPQDWNAWMDENLVPNHTHPTPARILYAEFSLLPHIFASPEEVDVVMSEWVKLTKSEHESMCRMFSKILSCIKIPCAMSDVCNVASVLTGETDSAKAVTKVTEILEAKGKVTVNVDILRMDDEGDDWFSYALLSIFFPNLQVEHTREKNTDEFYNLPNHTVVVIPGITNTPKIHTLN